MNFSDQSEEMLKLLLPHFEKHPFKQNYVKQRQTDNILRILYNDIKLATQWASAQNVLTNVKSYLNGDNESITQSVPSWMLHESKYMPKFTNTYIIDNLKGYVIYTCNIGDRKVEIYFGVFEDKDFKSLGKFHKKIKKMIIWLKLAFKYAPDKCSKTLKIYCFLTHFKKKIPETQLTTLSQDHCNSAVTTSCVPHGEIIIYRDEEFFKVFIHETFHTLGLDFSSMQLGRFNKKIAKIFPIKSEFNLFEAYSEFWASTINCLISSFLLTDKQDEEEFNLYSEFCLRSEQIFSLFQMVKVLDFMGITYQTLYNNDTIVRQCLFKEKTNVFAYYIIKSVLLYNNDDFMIWCKHHNDNIFVFKNTAENLDSFIHFITSKYKNPDLLRDIEKMSSILKKQKHRTLNTTLRMSLLELN